MKIVNINISEIKVQNRLWNIDESIVDNLIESIKVIGLKTPVAVRKDEYGQYILIAGGHRLEACKKLGFTTIPCIVEDVTEDFAIIHEIDENITRRTVTGIERSYQLAERKKAYDRAFNIELSAKVSFNSYFKDVEAIVNKERKQSLYDYNLFTERDLEKQYFKGRVVTNNMEDLFGRYINKSGQEARHDLTNKEIKIAEQVYYLMIEIGKEVNFIDDFVTDTAKKTNLDEKTIINELQRGGKVTKEDIEVIKKANISDRLARDIVDKRNKNEIISVINTIAEKEKDLKSLNNHIKESFKEAKREVVGDKQGHISKDIREEINNKAVELISNYKPKDFVQKIHHAGQFLQKDSIKYHIEKISKVFGVTTDKVIMRYENDEVFVNIKR